MYNPMFMPRNSFGPSPRHQQPEIFKPKTKVPYIMGYRGHSANKEQTTDRR